MSLPKALDAKSTVFLIRNPARVHIRAFPHIQSVCKPDRIYDVIFRSQEKGRLDLRVGYFHMTHGDGQAGLVVLCNLASELESSAQFEFCVAIEAKVNAARRALKEKSVSKKKRILVQNLALVSAL